MTRKRPSRRAALLVAVLVCSLVSLSLLATNVRVALRQRMEQRNQLHLQQAALLLDAARTRAIERVGERVGEANEYRGEQWAVGPALPAFPASTITIEILEASSPNDDNGPAGEAFKTINTVAVLAIQPNDPHSIRLSETFTWKFSPSSTAEAQ